MDPMQGAAAPEAPLLDGWGVRVFRDRVEAAGGVYRPGAIDGVEVIEAPVTSAEVARAVVSAFALSTLLMISVGQSLGGGVLAGMLVYDAARWWWRGRTKVVALLVGGRQVVASAAGPGAAEHIAHAVRRAAGALPVLLVFLLGACNEAPVTEADAEPSRDVVSEPAPCGGACGPGTVCELGRCVAVVGPDAAPDVADAAVDAAAPDSPAEAGVDAAAPDAPTAACDAGLTRCGDRCVDTSSDPDNCGSCGTRCGRDPTRRIAPFCASGMCVTRCEALWADCDMSLGTNGCETSLARINNCGSCGTDCGRNGACVPTDGGFACR